jgi:hypothetical protein
VKVVAVEDGYITDLNYLSQCVTGSENIKAVVWDASRNVLQVGGITNVTSYNWYQVPLYVRIVNGLSYYLGFVREGLGGDLRLRYDITSLPSNYYGNDQSNSYSSPQSIEEVDTPYDVKMYANYVPGGPALKIEGIYPGKLEGVDWVDIEDIS